MRDPYDPNPSQGDPRAVEILAILAIVAIVALAYWA
jgi:hypothetical protein